MKFKDKNGNVFVPTSDFTINEMLKSTLYEEVKDSKNKLKNKEKDICKNDE